MGTWHPFLDVRSWGRAVVDLIYPGRCAACDDFFEGPLPVCIGCLDKLRRLATAPACAWCAMPLTLDGAPCSWCLGKGLHPLGCTTRLGLYAEPLRGLILKTKYHRRWPLGEFLADELLRKDAARAILENADCLVPVPLHWWRQLRRTYNQAHVIAARLGRVMRRPVVHPAVRIRDTASQTRLARSDRGPNVRDAFALARPGVIAGKRIVLIDDVLTTGETLRSLARTLAPARPLAISALTLAAADPRHESPLDQ